MYILNLFIFYGLNEVCVDFIVVVKVIKLCIKFVIFYRKCKNVFIFKCSIG